MVYKKIASLAQEEIIKVMQELRELNVTTGCQVLRLKPRRYYRWLHPKPRLPKKAWNRITTQEEQAIVESGRDEKLVDLRAAGLMVYGHESGKFHCSVSTVQRVLIKNKLQPMYVIPTRKRPVKPDIRQLMDEPKKIFSYDATDFYLTNRLRVTVISILDLGSRKFIHYGIRVNSFTQKDVMDIFDEALWQEGLDTKELTVLSDRGSQMKGSRTRAHLIGKWEIKLEFARPYTPDDNAWIEALTKYMKYHPECPDSFVTVSDVTDWIPKFQKLYNDHPHSSLGYVRPNEEHAGLGKAIRQERKENLLAARNRRLTFYKLQKTGIGKLGNNFGGETTASGGEDFQAKSSVFLCQNR